MYIFVFMWSPVLEDRIKGKVPFGLIFSTFMVAIMIGSMWFKKLAASGISTTRIALLAFSLGILSFLVPSLVTVI